MFDLDIVRFVSKMNEEQENEFFEEAKAQGLINEELACIIRANAKVARLNADGKLFMALKGVADILTVKNPDVWKEENASAPLAASSTAATASSMAAKFSCCI